MDWWVSYLIALFLGILWASSLLLFCTFLINKDMVNRNLWMFVAMASKISLMVLFVFFVVSFASKEVGSSLLIFGFSSALVFAIWLKRIFVSADLTNLKKI